MRTAMAAALAQEDHAQSPSPPRASRGRVGSPMFPFQKQYINIALVLGAAFVGFAASNLSVGSLVRGGLFSAASRGVRPAEPGTVARYRRGGFPREHGPSEGE